MSDANISYQTACVKHPTLVAEVIKNIKRGRSKVKNDDPSSFTWGVNWGERCESFYVSNMFNRKKFVYDSADDMVNGRMSKIEGKLTAKKGKCTWFSDSNLIDKSDIQDIIIEEVKQSFDRQKKYNSMSDQEKQKELSDAIKELSKYKGFVAITVK